MARSRNIKPGLCKNEDLAECSIWARHLFACLPMLADREGRLEDRPKRIKAEIFPFDTVDVEPLLRELAARGSPRFIVRYQNAAGKFIQITRFKDHQTPHYSEKKSVIEPPQLQEKSDGMKRQLPESSENTQAIKGGSQPPDSLIPDSLVLIPDSPNPDSLIPDSGKEHPARKRASRKTPIPEGFQASDRVRQWAGEKGYDRVEQHCEAFVTKAKAHGYTYADWDRALMNAITEDWAGLRNGSVADRNQQAAEAWLRGDA